MPESCREEREREGAASRRAPRLSSRAQKREEEWRRPRARPRDDAAPRRVLPTREVGPFSQVPVVGSACVPPRQRPRPRRATLMRSPVPAMRARAPRFCPPSRFCAGCQRTPCPEACQRYRRGFHRRASRDLLSPPATPPEAARSERCCRGRLPPAFEEREAGARGARPRA